MSAITPFAFLMVVAMVGLAALAAALRWREPLRRPQTVTGRRPIDGEPHTLTFLGADGRPNPLRYEIFPDYPAALTRQRELFRNGEASVVIHAESGEVRIDVANMFGPFRLSV